MIFLRYIFYILSYIIPVSKKIYVFHSFPDFTDNTYAIYQYIIKNCEKKCIWLVDDKKVLRDVNLNGALHKAYLRYSLRGLWFFFRAKFVFCTHGIFNAVSLCQSNKIVNMWHGMPLKRIGSMDSEFGGKNPIKADFLVATSHKFQDIMSCSFGNMDKTRVLITGQPRNDLLFENTDFFEKHKLDRYKYRKVGIWLPTYRKSYVGDIRLDGTFIEDGISFLSFDQLAQLNDSLNKKKDLLIVKLHPMDILQQKIFPAFSNILILKQADLKCQLYPLLGNCDYLLTDYSSVWVDYEIMDKPIGFVMDDIEQYRSSRGFNFDNMDKILPGPILSSLEDLISFCETPEKYNYERTNLFNEFKDNKSSQRLMEALNKIS